MLTYDFGKREKTSLYEYLYKCIKEDILSGKIKANEKLPSKREMAKNHDISVITVENAYAQLIVEGYIYTKEKKGYFASDIGSQYIEQKPKVKYEKKKEKKKWLVDFNSNHIMYDSFPFATWSRIMRQTLLDKENSFLSVPEKNGVMELREAIADHLQHFRGMNVNPDNIIVGAGTEYLYSIIVQLLGRDKVIAVEDPGYKKIGNVYESNGVKCLHIKIDQRGIQLNELVESKADAVHISPSHQFPTGRVMPISRRTHLLKWAINNKKYIIEDDYDSEFRLSGKPIPSLQSIDVIEKVIYINTFTKSLASTIRISYMILPEKLMTRFYRQLSFYSCTVSNFEQYTLSRFIEEGKFETHVNRLRNHYRKKRDLLMEALKRSRLKDRTTVSGEEAGLHFLMHIKTDLPEEQVIANAREKGIRLVPLSSYYYGTAKEKNVYVMNYSSIDIEKADEIMERICTSCE